jgi:hypothetical protein
VLHVCVFLLITLSDTWIVIKVCIKSCNQSSLLAYCWLLAWLALRQLGWKQYVTPKFRRTSTHGIVSHKVAFILVTIVSNWHQTYATRSTSICFQSHSKEKNSAWGNLKRNICNMVSWIVQVDKKTPNQWSFCKTKALVVEAIFINKACLIYRWRLVYFQRRKEETRQQVIGKIL